MTGLVLALLALQDVDGLLRSLEDEKLETRERAATGLLDRWESLSDADLEKLRRAAAGPQAETSARAGELLRRIALRRKLGANGIRRLPKSETALLSGTAEERKEVLYEVHRLWMLGDLDSADARAFAEVVGEDGWDLVGEASLGKDRIIKPFIPVFRTGLKHPRTREQALDTLGSLDAREAAEEVIPMLRDADPKVRAAAAEALVEWGIRVDPAQVAGLLQEKDRNVKAQALRVLAKLKDPSTADAVAKLLTDTDEGHRFWALQTLEDIGAKNRAADVVTRLYDDSPGVRCRALRVLAHWKIREHAPAILRLLNDPIAGVQHEAEAAVRALGAKEFADNLAPLVIRSDDGTRRAAWNLLSEGSDPRPKLLETLKHENAEVRESAVRFLGKNRAKEDGPVFVGLLRDPAPAVRRAALEKLSDRAYSDHIGAVAACLDDPDLPVRGFAASALVRMGDVSRSDRVAGLLAGEDDWQVALAVRSLGWMADRKHAKTLGDLLRKQPPSRTEDLVKALAQMGAREESGAIADLLDQPKLGVKSEVLEALWLLSSDRLEGCIDRVLQSEDEDGRETALKILGRIGTAEAVKKLEAYLEGSDRLAAAKALLVSGRPEVFEKAVRLFADEQWEIRGSMAWALARWASTGQAPPDRARLELMLNRLDESGSEAARKGVLIVRVGLKLREPAAILPVLAEEYGLPQVDHVLASLHAREALVKLHRRFELKEDLRSVEDLKRALDGVVEIGEELVFLGCIRKGLRATGMELLDRLTERTDLRGDEWSRVGFVAEKGVLRAVTRPQAVSFWLRQLGPR